MEPWGDSPIFAVGTEECHMAQLEDSGKKTRGGAPNQKPRKRELSPWGSRKRKVTPKLGTVQKLELANEQIGFPKLSCFLAGLKGREKLRIVSKWLGIQKLSEPHVRCAHGET
jgi:hypothetical protein